MPHILLRVHLFFVLSFSVITASLAAAENAFEGRVDARLIPAVAALDDGSGSGAQLTRGIGAAFPSTQSGQAARTGQSSGELLLELDVPQVNDAQLRTIAATGARVLFSSPRWNSVSVLAGLEQTRALSELPGVRVIKLASRARTRKQGAAPNQGDAAMKTDIIRNGAGLTGNGQKLGVLSDSFNDTPAVGQGTFTGSAKNFQVTNTKPQIAGELPASVQVLDVGPGGGTDEGEGMMEVLHDVAPNALLAFASAFNGQASFGANITNLRAAGCTITCDDVGYSDEPYFQDGPIAQAINDNYDHGVPHFTAAGNEADLGTLATYASTVPAANDDGIRPPSGVNLHNWGIGGATPEFLPIDVPGGGDLSLSMQWNQPYQSYALGPGSSVDLDIYVYDAPNAVTGNILAKSENAQFVGGKASNDPYEELSYVNSGMAAQRVYLAVNHHAGSRVNTVFRLTFFNFSDTSVFPLGGAGAMTIYGHAACAKAISMGAIDYRDIAGNGSVGPDFTNINAEPFSSKGGIGAGGIPYYFDRSGNPLAGAPVLVDKPDLAAPDGVDTSVFGGGDADNDGFPNFFGTSCAAPNAAALAALLLERSPASSPAQLKALLQAAARDIVANKPLSGAGPDAFTGAGLVDASAALALLPSILQQPANASAVAGSGASFSLTAAGAPALTYQWRRDGAAISGATGVQLVLGSVQATDGTSQFTCLVSNPYGSVLSAAVGIAVTLPPPAILTQPLDVQVNLGAPATFAVAAGPGVFQYQWRRNEVNIVGANTAIYVTPAAQASDDGALFRCVLTNPGVTLTSNNAKLTVNLPPVLVSAPSAAPQVAGVGQAIAFSAAAVGSRGQAVVLIWDFGDGTQATGTPANHAYAAPQSYAVTLTVQDSAGASLKAALTVFVFGQLGPDGLPLLDPAADNAPLVDALRQADKITPVALSVSKLTISLNFARGNSDSLTLSGTLPLPAGFTPENQTVLAIVGGLGRAFVLDAKGTAIAQPNGSFKLAFNPKRPDGQFARFALAIRGAELKNFFTANGLDNVTVRNQTQNIRASLFFDGGLFDKYQPQSYTATLNKTGKTR